MKRLLGVLSLCLVLGLDSYLHGQTELKPVVVEARPLGKFGFGTGTGGPIWNSKIGHLVINHLVPGGLAEKAGLHLGDEILSIDGLNVPGRSRKEVFAVLRDKEVVGRVVSFALRRETAVDPHMMSRFVLKRRNSVTLPRWGNG